MPPLWAVHRRIDVPLDNFEESIRALLHQSRADRHYIAQMATAITHLTEEVQDFIDHLLIRDRNASH